MHPVMMLACCCCWRVTVISDPVQPSVGATGHVCIQAWDDKGRPRRLGGHPVQRPIKGTACSGEFRGGGGFESGRKAHYKGTKFPCNDDM